MSSFIKLKKKIKKKTATIRRSFRWIHVHPANEHVRKVLVTAALAEAKLADGKRGLVRIPKRMFGEDELHGISALAGLEPVAVLACQRAGFKVMQIGERHDDLPEPAALPATQRWQDTAVLDLVRHHDAGVIHYDANNDVDPVCLVAQAAMAWPEKKIAVVANEVRETRRIRDALNSMGVLSVAANHQNRPSLYIDANGKWNEDVEGRRVVFVTTPRSGLSADPVNHKWLDLVFAMDAAAAWHVESIQWLVHAWRARLYGFLPFDRNPSPRERDQVAALFGFAEVMVPEHRKTERRVRVEFHHIQSGVGLRLTQQGENLKRAGLWNHVPRNQRVAFVANQVVPQHQQANGGVVVLVEGVEHALSLSSVLPGWPIVTAEYVNDAGLTTHQKDLLRAGRNPFRDYSKPVIATSSALEKLDLSAVAAIIRADGGIGLPQIARQQLIAEPTRAALELHEFDDRHHPELGHDSRIRRRQYVERGWFAPGVDLVSARAERFLDSRPTLGRVDK